MNYTLMNNKWLALIVVCALIGLPACWKKKKKGVYDKVQDKVTSLKRKVTMPFVKRAVKNEIEHDINSFKGLFEDTDADTDAIAQNVSNAAEKVKQVAANAKDTLYEWADTDKIKEVASKAKDAVYEWTDSDKVKEVAAKAKDTVYEWVDAITPDEARFKTVYFDFDQHALRADQKEVVKYDAAQLKQYLADARKEGKEPMIVIEGHACDSAGNDEYNYIKSQNRANAVYNLMKDMGVPTKNIKVVGRGNTMPAVIDGKRVAGSRTEQWPNRRVELHIIKS